jgi:hypothetical protein
MSRQPGLSEWIDLVSTHMPHLSVPQARVLALWSYGIALTRSCGRLTVATFLALLMGQKVATVEQRLYEWCCDTSYKAGAKRQPLDVTTCFAPLLRWIVTLWTGTHLALALDATSLGARFVVLTLSVVYRGCGLPVAWTVLPANQPGAWRREWLRLLRGVRPAIPPDWTGLVLADRGLWARWLFGRVVRLGWHPLLRINNGAKFRPAGQTQWYWLRELVRDVNQCWCGRGTAPGRWPKPCCLTARCCGRPGGCRSCGAMVPRMFSAPSCPLAGPGGRRLGDRPQARRPPRHGCRVPRGSPRTWCTPCDGGGSWRCSPALSSARKPRHTHEAKTVSACMGK